MNKIFTLEHDYVNELAGSDLPYGPPKNELKGETEVDHPDVYQKPVFVAPDQNTQHK